MGKMAGLDFRGGGDPVTRTTGITDVDNEGCASVCSPSGRFLFYANGLNVYDSTNNIMPNGDSIGGYGSCTQGTLIVPLPNDTVRYYLFFLQYENGSTKLRCKLVDMSMHNGLGAVDINFNLNDSILASNLSEKMIAMPGCSKDLWVIVHANTTDKFYAFNVNFSGVNLTPVESSFPNNQLYFYGVMKGSPLGNKLMICNPGICTYDFDPGTGQVSNRILHDFDAYYGGAFSPDGTKIYGFTFGVSTHLYQYDLSASNPSATKFQVDSLQNNTVWFWKDIKLATDGKLYMGSFNPSTGGMGRINFPNLAGAACGFQNAIPNTVFPFPAFLGFGLPNEIVLPGEGSHTDFNKILDTTICEFPYTQGITVAAPPGYTAYSWNDGSHGNTHTIHQPGKYWVHYNVAHCDFIVDSFIVHSGVPPLVITDNNHVLGATETYNTYQWYFEGTLIAGATQSEYTATENGWYSLKVTGEGNCSDSTGYLVGDITAINDIENLRGQISVFPNPSHHLITVKAPLKTRLQLVNIDGKQLLETADSQLDLSAYANGLYFLYIRDEKGNLVLVKKVVKN